MITYCRMTSRYRFIDQKIRSSENFERRTKKISKVNDFFTEKNEGGHAPAHFKEYYLSNTFLRAMSSDRCHKGLHNAS